MRLRAKHCFAMVVLVLQKVVKKVKLIWYKTIIASSFSPTGEKQQHGGRAGSLPERIWYRRAQRHDWSDRPRPPGANVAVRRASEHRHRQRLWQGECQTKGFHWREVEGVSSVNLGSPVVSRAKQKELASDNRHHSGLAGRSEIWLRLIFFLW